MASRPGILTDWPWKPLGSFKYLILAPWALHSTYSFLTAGEKERDLSNFLILPSLLLRMIHNQIWISYSRYRTAKGSNRIVDKSVEFEQIDREKEWDDQILFNGILFYLGMAKIPGASNLPMWRTDGVLLTALLHTGPVEFLYYWFHRALHHHFLYSRYHSHHHSSIVTEPITSVIHPFAEHIVYFMLFALPMLTTIFTGVASVAAIAGYLIYVDLMNNMGHCNFEFIPKRVFSAFPPLKYLMYTPSFHSLHHTKFRTNYSLFMPFYDYIYGTMDESTDKLHTAALAKKEDVPEVVHLTHLTTPESIYHLRLGFAAFASKPYTTKWFMWLLWPVTLWSMTWTWIHGRSFVIERNRFKDLTMQTWVIPKYKIQYWMQWQRESINSLIDDAIVEAEEKGVKVLSLGLLNQGKDLNGNGELYIRKYPKLKIRLVDGSSLASAIVLNKIPKGTSQVLLTGQVSKIAHHVAVSLCGKGTKVVTTNENVYNKLKNSVSKIDSGHNLVLSETYDVQIWLVGGGLSEAEHLKAPKNAVFVPFSQIPPKELRPDCFYHSTPAMIAPPSLENIDSCENWLPRRVMSAWRVAGIVHALEGIKEHECGSTILNSDAIWQAALKHGFQPLNLKNLHLASQA
uniref:Uncharacterized protein n=1 Tax=Kalanchoe fedtschenkoi TaxID=63787 RepID=A0A7N0TDU3_KALFE